MAEEILGNINDLVSEQPSFEKAKRDYPRLTQEAEEIRRRELLPDGGGMIPTSRVIPGVTEKYYETLGIPRSQGQEEVLGNINTKKQEQGASLDKFMEKSIPERMVDIGAGLVEPALSLPLGLPNFVETTGRKGWEYLKDAIKGNITLDTEKRAQEAASKAIIPGYHGFTETGKLGIEGLGKMFEWVTRLGAKAISEPHAQYSNLVRKVIGQQPLSSDERQVLENVAMLPIEAAMAALGVKGTFTSLKNLRKPEEQPKVTEEPSIREVDTTKYNQMDLPFGEERLPVKAPYDVLPPEVRARLEAELNPPVEQRRGGQGELFTEERPYARDELIAGRPVEMTPPERSIRETPGTEWGTSVPDPRNLPHQYDLAWPTEQTGRPAPLPDTLPWTGPGRRQRGAIGFMPERPQIEPIERQRTILDREKIALTNSLKRNEDMVRDLESGNLSQAMRDYLAREKISPMQLRQETKQNIESLKKDIARNEDMLKTILEKQERPKATVTSISPFKGRGKKQGGWIKFPGGSWNSEAIVDILKGLMSNQRFSSWDATYTHIMEKYGNPIQKKAHGLASEKTQFLSKEDLANGAEIVETFGPKIESYLKKYAGTERDPLNNIQVREGLSWENLMDGLLINEPDLTFNLGKQTPDFRPIRKEQWDTGIGRADWYAQLDAETSIHKDKKWQGERFGENSGLMYGRLNRALTEFLGHVYDNIVTNIPKDKYSKMDFVTMVKESQKIDTIAEAKMKKSRENAERNLDTVKEYQDGSKWVRLNKPGQFAAESDMMGHSVRGYEPVKGHPDHISGDAGRGGYGSYGIGGWEAIKKGTAEIYSLRDSNKKSTATIEIQRNQDGTANILQIKGSKNQPIPEQYRPHLYDFLKDQNIARANSLDISRNGLFVKEHSDFTGEYSRVTLVDQETGNPINRFPDLPTKTRTFPEGGPGSRQRGFIDFRRKVKDKGLAPALLEYRKQFEIDRRPIAEIAKEMQEKKTPDIGEIAKGGGYVAIPSQLGFLTKNPLIKAVTDRLGELRRDTANKIRDALTGVKYETNIFGREKRVWGEEGGLTKFRRFYHESKARRAELSEMKDTWIQSVGKDPLTRNSFRTERQWETYSAMKKVLDKARDDVNKALESAGRKPIEWVENYFPAIWEGDFRVWVRDGNGELKHVVGVTSMREANKIKAEFQKAAPDMVVEAGQYKKGKYDMSDLSAFEEAARVLEKEGNTKLSAEFNRIYANVMSHRGFGKHGLQRKGVEGFLGSEKGIGGLKDMEHAYETYITRAYRFISNIEKAKLHAELDALPKDIRKSQERAIEISKAYIDQARGKTYEEPLTNAANWLVGQIGEKVPFSGLGQGSLRRGMHNISALVLPYWLLTGKFMLANMIQPTVNLAQLSRLKATGETAAMPGEALMAGYKNIVLPDKSAIDGANWASRKGYLDPTIAGLLEAKLQTSPSSATRAVMELMRKPTGWLEQHAVRLPSFLMYEYALRDTIKDPTKRYEKAAEIMNDRMVDYDLSNSPLMYGKLGLAGESIRPLKQYPHNMWGQFLDYAAYTKDTKSVGPMAYYFGQQIAMAGLKGLAFVPEVTAIILLINAVFNQDVPTPEHALMTSGMSDWLVMGGLSTALGYDVSKSVSHPSLPIMLQSPPVVAAGAALKDVFSYLIHKVKGTATDADAMKAWLAITPNAAHGYIEELYTPEGGMTPNPNDDMRGLYKRNETEKLVSTLFGMRSTDEAKQRALNYGAIQLLKQDAAQKMEALSAIVDAVANKQKPSQKLIDQYIEEGGSPNRLENDIKKRIADRQLTPWERAAKGSEMTNNKWNKLKRMKEMMDADIERRGKDQSKSEPTIEWDSSPKEEVLGNINKISTNPKETPKMSREEIRKDFEKRFKANYINAPESFKDTSRKLLIDPKTGNVINQQQRTSF